MASRALYTGLPELTDRPGGMCEVKGKIRFISYRRTKKGKEYQKSQNYLLAPVIVGGVFYSHLWIRVNRSIRKLKPAEGDTLCFQAKVAVYNRELDAKLGVKQPYQEIKLYACENSYTDFISGFTK